MKTATSHSIAIPLLQVVHDSQTPVDQSLLRHLYKTDQPAMDETMIGIRSSDDSSNWDASWFSNYE